MTRRDLCYLVGKRAFKLHPNQAAAAWYRFATLVEGFGERDIPKFRDLLGAMRHSTIKAARHDPTIPITDHIK